jgi:hypothetical protein
MHIHIHVVSQFALKPVYTMLNSRNFDVLMTDIYLTIQIRHNTVVYLDFSFSSKRGEYSFNAQYDTDYVCVYLIDGLREVTHIANRLYQQKVHALTTYLPCTDTCN